jgi:hypothetical protein
VSKSFPRAVHAAVEWSPTWRAPRPAGAHRFPV